MATFIIIILIWLAGAIVAWIQIKYWNRDQQFVPSDYVILTMLSTLSWGIYPVALLEWICDKLSKDKE